MARPIARDAEDFARLMLQALERQGPERSWPAVRELFEQTAARHPEHPYLGHLAARPARRSALNAALERVRAAEFPHIERRNAGGRRHVTARHRTGQPALQTEAQAHVSLDLQLPYETPASHPLLDERRAVEARGERPASARRTALTEGPPRSPWRRRLLPRRLPRARGSLEQACSALRRGWQQLRAAVAGLADGSARR